MEIKIKSNHKNGEQNLNYLKINKLVFFQLRVTAQEQKKKKKTTDNDVGKKKK